MTSKKSSWKHVRATLGNLQTKNPVAHLKRLKRQTRRTFFSLATILLRCLLWAAWINHSPYCRKLKLAIAEATAAEARKIWRASLDAVTETDTVMHDEEDAQECATARIAELKDIVRDSAEASQQMENLVEVLAGLGPIWAA